MLTPDDTRAYIMQPLLEEHCNALGQVRTGYLLKLIDVIGAHSALKYVNNAYTVVTASLDRTNFKHTIRVWEFIAMESRVTQAWGSSMEVAVDVYAVPMAEPGTTETPKRRHVATSYLVYVAFDRERRKATLPKLHFARPAQLKASMAAELRKQRRLEESKAVPLVALHEDDATYWTEETKVATSRDANINGNVFGGVILEQMTRTARQAAEKHCLGATVVGARIDRMSFVAPGFLGETIRTRAIVTQSFKTSLELQVEIHAINPNEPESPRLIATSYMVFVRVTGQGRPADVPPWTAKTAAQHQRADDAKRRRELREQERQLMDDLPALPEDATWPQTLQTRWGMRWHELAQRLRLAWASLRGKRPALKPY